VAAALSDIRHLLIDLDGVVLRGRSPTPGAPGFFRRIRPLGVTFAVLTNNSTRTAEQYAELLGGMGIEVTPAEVFTSARATVAYLEGIEPQAGATVYAIGEQGLLSSLERAGYRLVEDSPKCVVVGLDRHFTYDKLRIAQRAIRSGARLIATNPDTTFPGEAEIQPGCGSLVAAVEAASGVHATVIGKPYPAMFQAALTALGATPETTAIVGDRLDTDIAGGARAGLTTVCVLTGVTDEPALRESGIHPDYVYPSLADFGAALARDPSRHRTP
jgi:4-nitrophenyl phosphatase